MNTNGKKGTKSNGKKKGKAPLKNKRALSKTTQPESQPIGRPTSYDSVIFPERAYKLTLLGLTNEQLAGALGIAVSTLYDWQSKHVEFAEAIKRGKEEADGKVAHSLYRRALGYSHPDIYVFSQTIKEYDEKGRVLTSRTEPKILDITKHYPPDPTSGIFWLKNRQPEAWRDVNRMEHSGPKGKAIPVESKNTIIHSVDMSDFTEEELALAVKMGVQMGQMGSKVGEES